MREGESYVLNGSKIFVPLAEEAEMILVYAAEDGITQGFFVPTDAEGLVVGRKDKLMGIRALPTYMVTLSDVRVPLENKLGGAGGIDFKAGAQPQPHRPGCSGRRYGPRRF